MRHITSGLGAPPLVRGWGPLAWLLAVSGRARPRRHVIAGLGTCDTRFRAPSDCIISRGEIEHDPPRLRVTCQLGHGARLLRALAPVLRNVVDHRATPRAVVLL